MTSQNLTRDGSSQNSSPIEPTKNTQHTGGRQFWQIAQAERCACRGADDLCQCQNADEPWKYGLGGERPPTRERELERRIRELEGNVRTLELQQQTDRQTIRLLAALLVAVSDEDAIADALEDSIDMDWTTRIGARAVVAHFAAILRAESR